MAESGRAKIYFVYGRSPKGLGFGRYTKFEHENIEWVKLDEIHPFGEKAGKYVKGILRYISQISPDAVLIWSNPRFLSFWAVLAYCAVKKIPVYTRGHGLVKKKKVGLLHSMMYKAIIGLSTKYICYTENVRKTLLPLDPGGRKLAVDNNTLVNGCPNPPTEKTGREKGIFYLGRIRENCGVEVLVDAVTRINLNRRDPIELHIIGDGPLSTVIREKDAEFPWLHYYGGIFDEQRINEISRLCRIGCVPGFMGLNVVHIFSLSLPIVTHNVVWGHGPEAEYIKHLENGFLFNRSNDLEQLVEALTQMWSFPTRRMKDLQRNAFMTYQDLHNPPFHERTMDIMEF
jgi:glycosyltransferase involved in cell wall biosynthesis